MKPTLQEVWLPRSMAGTFFVVNFNPSRYASENIEMNKPRTLKVYLCGYVCFTRARCCLWAAVVEGKHLTRRDERTRIALHKEAKKLALRQTRSVHRIEFNEFAPVRLFAVTKALSMIFHGHQIFTINYGQLALKAILGYFSLTGLHIGPLKRAPILQGFLLPFMKDRGRTKCTVLFIAF